MSINTIIASSPASLSGESGSEQSKFDAASADIHGINDMPGHLIRRLHQVAVATFADATATFAVTPVQYAALSAIARFPGIDQRSVANLAAFDASTIGDVIKRLEGRELLERAADESDRRIKRVYLTGKGQALLQEIDPLVVRSQETLLSPLSEGERTIFVYLLRRLATLSNESSPAPLRTSPH